MNRTPSMACPHCEGPTTARTSTRLSSLYREVTFQCRNTMCGHVFVAGLEAIRTLSPSAIPNPEINLPFSPHVRKRELQVQLQLSLEKQGDEPV